MEQINKREVPNFYDFETTVKNDSKLDMQKLIQFIKEKVTFFVSIRIIIKQYNFKRNILSFFT